MKPPVIAMVRLWLKSPITFLILAFLGVLVWGISYDGFQRIQPGARASLGGEAGQSSAVLFERKGAHGSGLMRRRLKKALERRGLTTGRPIPLRIVDVSSRMTREDYALYKQFQPRATPRAYLFAPGGGLAAEFHFRSEKELDELLVTHGL